MEANNINTTVEIVNPVAPPPPPPPEPQAAAPQPAPAPVPPPENTGSQVDISA